MGVWTHSAMWQTEGDSVEAALEALGALKQLPGQEVAADVEQMSDLAMAIALSAAGDKKAAGTWSEDNVHLPRGLPTPAQGSSLDPYIVHASEVA